MDVRACACACVWKGGETTRTNKKMWGRLANPLPLVVNTKKDLAALYIRKRLSCGLSSHQALPYIFKRILVEAARYL